MSFLISDAIAAEAPAMAAGGQPQGSGLEPLIMLGLLFVLFYFLLIRPQTKRAKEHKNMVESLSKGDEVVTNGGILGRINEIEDTFLTLEIAEGTEVKLQRNAVTSLVPKGTYKSGS
ncbi:preprotein translocase subunit YajC [Kaarinaea lacus]